MTITLSVPASEPQLQPKIAVIGVGGAGGNAVNNMIDSHLEGVDFIAANTDAQALRLSLAERKIQLGHNITQGLGAGSRPDIGRAAAEEALDEIMEQLQGTHMVFVTAGMGGGTGTGAAPVIAKLAREHGILTVGVVTRPFQFEGLNRMRIADAGIEEMQQFSDTLIVIPNQNLFRLANERTTFAEAFTMADQVLHSGVRGVTDLMVVPGLINLDFADIRAVMSEMGKAMMGTGEAEGDDRARLAAEAAISNPLLDEVSMRGARGVLINITGGPDMTLFEVDEAANRIGEEVDNDSNIIFGSTLNAEFEGRIRVSVVATGIDADSAANPRPVLRVFDRPTPIKRPDIGEQPDSRIEPLLDSGPEPLKFTAPAASSAPASNGVPAPDPTPAPMAPRYDGERPARLVVAPAGAAPEPAADEAADAPFIPPRPAEPLSAAGNDRPADPFAEADMVNGGEPPRRPSLLQRMAAGALARKDVAGEAEIRRPAPPAPPVLAARETPEQPLLAGVARSEPTRVQRSEEDLLDIPAFLRRQAN